MTTDVLYTEGAGGASGDDLVELRLFDSDNVPGYNRGGLVEAAEAIRKAGRYGDDILVHMTRDEFEELARAWGPYTINPQTGMPEYFLKRLFKKAKKFVGRLAKNPIVRAVAPIAMNVLLPGVGGLIGQAAFGAASSAASGGNPLLGGLMGAGGHFLGGGSMKAPQGGGPLSRFLPGRGGAASAIQPIDMSTLPQRVGQGALGQAGGSGFLSGLGGKLKDLGSKALGWFKDPVTGKMKWGRVAMAGLGGLGALSAVRGIAGGGGDDGGAPPALPERFGEPLPQLPFERQRTQMPAEDYYSYGQTGGEHEFFSPNVIPQGQGTGNTALDVPQPPVGYATDPRAIYGYKLGGLVEKYKAGGHVAGPGTGRSDDIPAVLSDGEYVIDAESVALLGDGSTNAGAKRLDEMRNKLRKHKGKKLAEGGFSHDAKTPEQYMAEGGEVKKNPYKKGTARYRLWNKRYPEGKKEAKEEKPKRLKAGLARKLKGRSADELREMGEMKKGGGVGSGMSDLKGLADRLEKAITSGNKKRVKELSDALDSLHPGSSDKLKTELARGGRVSGDKLDAVARRLGRFSPSPEALKKWKATRMAGRTASAGGS